MKKYNTITSSDIGTFITNRNDLGVGWQLANYGTYDPAERDAISLMARILRDKKARDLKAIDIGANIGVFSVLLSDLVGPHGIVYSFEAQRIVYYMLAGNISINSKSNVHCFHKAVSDKLGTIEIPKFSYQEPLNIGSIEFDQEQSEWIGQTPSSEADEKVEAITIDAMNYDGIDLMKVDVEGMEEKVLIGAEKTIMESRPIIICEYLKGNSENIKSWLTERGYKLYSGIGDNYISLPSELMVSLNGLTEVN